MAGQRGGGGRLPDLGVEEDPALLARLPDSHGPAAEQAILFEVEAWDINCPQHIPQKLDPADVVQVIAERDKRIAELEAEVTKLKTLVPF